MSEHVLIIAEIGVNHNGSLELAKKMVDEVKKCGADIAKFQTALPEKLISRAAPKAEYQKETTGSSDSQLEMIKKITLPLEAYGELSRYCKELGIGFLSTPFDLESIEYLDSIGMRLWKIPSGEVTNLPYLEKIGETGYPVIMSTGMCTMEEVGRAIDVLRSKGTEDIKILHCTTEYPAPMGEVNLKAMDTLRDSFGLVTGYSDHTEGIEVAIAAAARGAAVIEKHFTLDRNMEGPDHRASTEPQEFARMVSSIRNIEKALGTGEKKVTDSERKNIAVARKSIVASRDIKKGEVLSGENLTAKRPGNGISPMKWYDVIGTKAIRDFQEDELIEL